MNDNRKQIGKICRYLLIEAMGGACVFCRENDPTILQFAHVKPTKLKGSSRGYFNRLRDVFENRECYRLMCETHHRQFDAGELKLKN